MIILDIDDFKIVNDTVEHLQGNRVLIQVAHELMKCLSKDDIVARIGGDEFLAFVKTNEEEVLRKRANTLLERIQLIPFE
ncbi:MULTISPECIES: GGDEF domain-containing protein [Bacillus]|uniref:GGDEF domain-containing protein n=1 Tax=Bacillus TaxID=1386 RepID=UPI0003005802|nr:MULTISPECIES: GGDEF domain-containing protein [Bacillus]